LVDFSKRFELHPRKFEELTESIFREQGYTTLLTPYSGDDGIDIFLFKDNMTVGVQVKRHKQSIEVSQIREFVGALELQGTKQGVFVTTSRYSKGVHRTVQNYSERGWCINLIDCTDLLDALSIPKRAPIVAPQLDHHAFSTLVSDLHFIQEWHDW
jgi:restriction system protein